MKVLASLVALLATAGLAWAETYIEGGALANPRFLLSTGLQPNASQGWDIGILPTARLEQWWRSDKKLEIGITAVPFYFETTQVVAAPLTIEDQTFSPGQQIRFRYQFHNLRGTAAVRVYESPSSSLRIGGSLIGRYAELRADDGTRRDTSRNFIAFPLPHVTYRRDLSSAAQWMVRADALPLGSPGTGIYDIFAGIEGNRESNSFWARFGGGVRIFWGGYSPQEPGENNNEIFFWGPVARFRF